MSTNKTKNLGLHSWVREDRFLMDEFNENFSKLDKAVGAKAEQDALDALTGQVAAKAEQSALETLTRRVDKKAEQTALEALAGQAATKTALDALTGRVGTLENWKLVWKYGEYTGDGNHGESTPTRLEFDFKPVALFVCQSGNYQYGGFLWLRPMIRGRSVQNSSNINYLNLTWEDRAVRWYSGYSTTTAMDQLNAANTPYAYLAFGIEE